MRYKYYGTLDTNKLSLLDKQLNHKFKLLIRDGEVIEHTTEDSTMHAIWTIDVTDTVAPIFQELGTYEEVTTLPEVLKPWILGFR